MANNPDHIQTLNSKLKDLLSEMLYLKQLRDEHRKTIDDLLKENRKLKADVQELQKQGGEQSATEEVKALQARLDRLEAENKALKARSESEGE